MMNSINKKNERKRTTLKDINNPLGVLMETQNMLALELDLMLNATTRIMTWISKIRGIGGASSSSALSDNTFTTIVRGSLPIRSPHVENTNIDLYAVSANSPSGFASNLMQNRICTVKHMALNFTKLEKFKRIDFRRWQKKMHFFLSSMSMVYVLTTPMPEDGCENPTVKQVKIRAKWDSDNYVFRDLILNGMSDSLFDVYQNFETSKELWDTLEAKYMAEDASSKKFLVSNFKNYKMTDSRPDLEQYNELLGILGWFTQHKINMDESIQDSNKPKVNNVVGPSVVNMVEHNNSFRKPGHLKRDCKGGNVGNKANGSSTKGSGDRMMMLLDGLTLEKLYIDLCDLHATPSLGNKKYFVTFIDDASRVAVRLPDAKLKTLVERGIKCIFVGYGKHSKAFEFYVIEPNDSVAINSINQRMLSLMSIVVSERVTKEVVQQPESELRKRKRHRTSKDFRPEFQLYLIEETKDEISDQHSYYFNVEDDPKTFNEEMKSQDVTPLFVKKTLCHNLGVISKHS
nr:zinc finger, CCHC-type [Tanacetum cinerariifolium]